ncbi:hypothetical protein NQ317_010173 [Molorchus minor]|uniref:Fatty acid desaturase domain-containing protein n=1 Tax=Molorchus minor TaxID=1323400 RepID=A0ABQ9IWW3_9CUCU|nr:hypothetical protein NQ317_010173 [Molorchus minor]
MAPNLLGTAALFLAEPSSAEPVQIISSPDVQNSYTAYQRQTKRTVRPTGSQYTWEIVWRNVIIFFILHTISIYGIYLMITKAMWTSIVFYRDKNNGQPSKMEVLGLPLLRHTQPRKRHLLRIDRHILLSISVYLYALMAGMGITAGAHRLWGHRTYKAKLPLRILLMICQSAALQNHIYEWVRDHRVHHKFTDTDADPHNAKRGFFFSHIGWLMVKKHKDVLTKGKTVDLSDLEADPVVRFQRKYYVWLTPFLCFLVPAFIPWYFWGEAWWLSFYVLGITRYTLSLNGTWLVNSAAHIYGTKPYDKNIKPTESTFVAVAAFGEGWHNFHHVFPWDYKAAELGNYRLNFTTAFLDLMAIIGWAYDLKKTVSPDMVKKSEHLGLGMAQGPITKSLETTRSESDDHHQNSRNICPPDDKFSSILPLGEGWHNYHHAFPWDYRSSEIGGFKYNMTTSFIDLMGKIGWASHFKMATTEAVKKQAESKGDGSRIQYVGLINGS